MDVVVDTYVDWNDIGDVSVVLLLGGLSALISASLVYILRVYVLENDELPNAPQVLLDEQSRFSE
jgi:hypothetical protein